MQATDPGIASDKEELSTPAISSDRLRAVATVVNVATALQLWRRPILPQMVYATLSRLTPKPRHDAQYPALPCHAFLSFESAVTVSVHTRTHTLRCGLWHVP